ncbi:indolepyruvate ferredoxin oxidoreductase subunit alpha [Clostridium sp. D2Q-14]|uniref:indolepyruvate ferredoxin oxidoreductase subunit alpha n=1 Tax=Anaeromonas gelatinilytica TaxID=2683194 RepID=UPI00193B57E2|nr:indolepyruvate ferredoxin oxidoreductase subunit alpha [Anaeromonas gelatinilytica]MBS4535299.1 indolepyruvate ferredoxin oxidoreductase subunit alpha [Anaeromonas gelatinilytica]
MKKLLTGNEAVARGAYEAGVTLASAYPGTPSTEILENIAKYKEDIYSEWAPNEKVALEVAIGGSIAGARTLAAMKHVGVNVAADPLFTFGYTGVNGGCVIVSADDPGMHSSQNEQDNRYYAKASKIAMIEPSDSQEAKDYIKEAYKISEKYDVPILYRLTTRICHSKGLVEENKRNDIEIKEYTKNIPKYVATPANGRKLHVIVEDKLKKLEEYSNITTLNRIEWNDKKIGVITSGVAYQYSKEVFREKASYLKLGFTFPLPKKKIKEFADSVEKLYVIEELEPYLETEIRAMGIKVIGKDLIPIIGELNPDIIRESLFGEKTQTVDKKEDNIVGRPPSMCAGCPHRGLYYELSKKKNIVVTGDIGCYTLGSAPPLSTMDTCICMGASISAGHGFNKASEVSGRDVKVFGVIGDSTFFHSGITGLIDIVYNSGNSATIILDNRITGMTGHQENPGTGFTLMGEEAPQIDIVKVCEAIGVRNIEVINPLNLDETKNAIDKAMKTDEPMIIITKYPCVLKKSTQSEIENYGLGKKSCIVDQDICKKCKMCLKAGCPAISFDSKIGSIIDEDMCVGCDVCLQICPFDAIKKVGE